MPAHLRQPRLTCLAQPGRARAAQPAAEGRSASAGAAITAISGQPGRPTALGAAMEAASMQGMSAGRVGAAERPPAVALLGLRQVAGLGVEQAAQAAERGRVGRVGGDGAPVEEDGLGVLAPVVVE